MSRQKLNDECAVAQVPGIGPIDESDLTDQLRFYPTALLHLLRPLAYYNSQAPENNA